MVIPDLLKTNPYGVNNGYIVIIFKGLRLKNLTIRLGLGYNSIALFLRGSPFGGKTKSKSNPGREMN